MDLTDRQRIEAQRGRLDVFCPACSVGSAITARCYRCGSDALLVAAHNEQAKGAAKWCRGGRPDGD